MEVKFISYNGSWPCLCGGTLVVEVEGKKWEINGLSSGGSAGFTANYEDEYVESGPWSINDYAYPEGFPEKAKEATERVANDNIVWGCCGGCL